MVRPTRITNSAAIISSPIQSRLRTKVTNIPGPSALFGANKVMLLGTCSHLFLMVSSYRQDTVTSGHVELRLDLTQPVEGVHVLLVDDIVDTGISITWLIEHVTRKNPAGVRVCALLDKPARRRVPVKIDYLGFEVPDRFVVGYGIDCAGRHRELPFVGYVAAAEEPTTV